MSSTENAVLLFSNGKSMTEKENTLSAFSGKIPSNFLAPHKEWKVGLNSCGLHLNLKQKLCSKNSIMPALIQISLKDFSEESAKYPNADNANLPLAMFRPHHRIYINNHRSYTARTLAQHIRKKVQKEQIRSKTVFCGFPAVYKWGRIQFGQFPSTGVDAMDTNNQKELRTFVFLNKYFYKHLNLSKKEKMRTTLIDGEQYHFFFNSEGLKSKSYYPFEANETKFNLEKPKLIQITSDQIDGTIYNGSYKQCLRQFTTTSTEVGKYVHYEFDDLEFSNVSNTSIDTFSVKILDHNFKKLRLLQGLPSYVKLVFSPAMKHVHEEHVRVSSAPNDLYADNNIASFNVELPKTLDFSWTKNPKVALTRISFQNKWKIMPGLSLNLFMHEFGSDLGGVCKGIDRERERTCEDILKNVEWEFHRYNVIRAKKQLDGTYSITFITDGMVILGRDLCQILGFDFADKLGHNTCMKINKGNTITTNFFYSESNAKEDVDLRKKIKENINRYQDFRHLKKPNVDVDIKAFFASGEILICGEKGATFNLPYQPRTIELYPNNIFIYSNFVAGSAVLGEYKKLLRIIHLPHDKKEEHHTIDFTRLDFLALSELKIKTMQFHIVTIDGRNVEPYDILENVYLNLMFVHDI